MPTPDGSAQLCTNVGSWSLSINALASSLPSIGRLLALDQARQELKAAQDLFVDAVRGGLAELVCERCGVVHSGPSIVRRGSRLRKLKTSTGVLEFELKQLTCRDCRRTWSPFATLISTVRVGFAAPDSRCVHVARGMPAAFAICCCESPRASRTALMLSAR